MAVFQHIAAVSQFQRLVGVLLDKEDGHPLLAQLFDGVENLLDDDRRQSQRGLIKQQQARLAHQRPTNRHNYHNVIPNGSRTSVVLDTKEFIETIERASLIITERLKNPLRISFTEGKVVVRCQTNLGRVVDEFNAQCEGDEVEIGFNNRYLLDALRNARTEQVKLEISGPLSPVKVLPTEGSDFLYLVLPVRFKND